jgi:hypothetical protein
MIRKKKALHWSWHVLALVKLLQISIKDNVFVVSIMLALHKLGILIQAFSIMLLVNSDRIATNIETNYSHHVVLTHTEPRALVIIVAIVLFWVAVLFKFFNRRASAVLMRSYSTNILEAFVKKHGLRAINKPCSAIAIQSATLVRRVLDAAPPTVAVLCIAIYLPYVSSVISTVIVIALLLVFLPVQYALARSSANIQARQASANKLAFAAHQPKTVEESLERVKFNIDKITQVALSQFYSGTLIFIILLALLLAESPEAFLAPTFIGLLLVFGLNLRSLFSTFVVLSRLRGVLLLFFEMLYKKNFIPKSLSTLDQNFDGD